MLDILVAGGGYVGLPVAVSIKKAAPHLNVMVADGAPEGAWQRDGRASAIAAAASRMRLCAGRSAPNSPLPLQAAALSTTARRRGQAARPPSVLRWPRQWRPSKNDIWPIGGPHRIVLRLSYQARPEKEQHMPITTIRAAMPT